VKQAVNLLRDDIKPVIQRLTLNRVALSVVLVLLLVFAAVGYTQWLSQQSNSRLLQAQQTLEQLKQKNEQRQQQLQQRQPSQNLVEKEAELEQQINAQQELNQRLSAQQSPHDSAPDQLMQELYSVDIDGLWLTEFSMTPAGVSLSGVAIKANLLPRWMQRFKQTQLLAKSRFAVVDLDRDEQSQQTFTLSNSETSEDSQ